ncbi:MAG: efflux RND transporter permease subunit [Planctomycetota bacterium]|nr:efflux RND transporter permease subunit [Planctomycetota bacterium]
MQTRTTRSTFAIGRPDAVVVVALAVLVVGITSYQKIPADLLPIFRTPAVQIVTFYPGMPPEVMERDIMSRLERWTGQSVGIEHQEAKAMQGVCVVKDFFREDISNEEAMAQVTSFAVSDMFYLPPGTVPPMVMPFDPTASVPLCLVTVSNPLMTEKELYDIAYYELRNQLQAIQGVIAPAVYGGKLRRILCYLDRQKLEARGLSLMDVQEALLKQNVLIPAGNAKMGDLDFQIFTNALTDTVDEINLTPIKIVDGAPVLLRDVGQATDAGQIQSNVVRINQKRQVYIPIYRQPGANTIHIVNSINERLARIGQRLKDMNADNPKMKPLVLSVVMDQSVGVRQSITGLQIAGGLGAVLAGLVVLVFLGSLRSSLIIFLAIPLSILVAIIGLFYTGDTINAMTLGGLALAVGILVDQSIVVLENIVRHGRMGKSSMDAAIDGASEVALPILVSTVTFCVVFYPIVFLSGLAKFLFTPLALAATIAIIASYLIAMTLVPSYCAKFLRTSTNGDAQQRPESSFMRAFGNFLAAVVAMRFVVVLIAAALFGGAAFLLTTMGSELFPPVDSGQFTIYVRLPSGTRIERTEEKIQQVEQVVMDTLGQADPGFAVGEEDAPDSYLQMVISNIGVLMDWPAAYTPNTGPMDSFVLVQLKDKAGRPGVFDAVSELRQKLNQQFPGVEFAFDTGGMMTAALNMGEPSPIHFQITGSKLDTAQHIARIVKEEAAQVPGAVDVRIAQRMDYPTLKIKMDRISAAYQGVNVDDVMKNLVSATNSSINFDPAFWIAPNGNHYFLGVQYAEADINSLDTLRDVPITGAGSTRPVSLRNVAEITQGTGPAVINHHNITRATDIYANVLPGYDVGTLVEKIEQRLEANSKLGLFVQVTERGKEYDIGGEFGGQGYTLQMQGEVRSMRDSFTQFTNGLVIAILLVYLVMVAQFRSFVDPFIILLTVPLGFVGVVGLLWATGGTLSIMSFMGLIMMVGIVVEYSIVLVDFANHRVRDGLSPRDAIIDATKIRLRPILMTSLTTWLALLPMAVPHLFLAPFGLSGGDANVPLARAIIGGVLGATVLSLLVVPCLYTIMKRTTATPLNSHSG